MKRILLGLILLLSTAGYASAAFKSDILTATDKVATDTIQARADANSKLRYNPGTDKWQFTNDNVTFYNLQSEITNPVTGTGTINTFPKFTGTSTLGDSIISDSGGTIFIDGYLTITESPVNPPSTYSVINLQYPTYDTNTDATFTGLIAAIRPILNTGTTNSGSIVGGTYQCNRNFSDATSNDSGLLNALFGNFIQYGHRGLNPNANPLTTYVYGLSISPAYQSGTITHMYDIYLAAPLTGGTVTNKWGIYQENTATNHLAGRLWLGLTSSTTSDTYILELPNSATKKALANAWDTYASSVQWKTNIATVGNPLGKLSMLDGITFKYSYPDVDEPVYETDNEGSREQIGTVKKPHPMTGIKGIGISAEDLDKLGIPGVTQKDKNGEYVGINLTNLIPVLVEAIKDLNVKVNDLESRLIKLESK